MKPAAWLGKGVLVCVGTGGVGKTTVSAAIALEGARLGLRTLVLTIDPARRLADAMGAGALGAEPQRIPPARLRAAGVEGPGTLDAMMLDTKRTFDRLVERYSPDEETLERIYANPIYQHLTDALAGTREYSAMEELHRIHVSGDYDLVVVDTPPARYALDFLDAPRRLTGLLDSQLLRVLFRPAVAMGRTGFRLFRLGSATVLRTIERVSGLEFLRTTSEFLLAFEGMLEGFRARAVETGELLRSSACGFILVAGPDPLQARLAASFSERLEQEGIELLGLVANRVHTWPGSGAAPSLSASDLVQERESLARRLAEPDPPFDSEQVAAVLVGVASRQARLAGQDAETLRCLAHELRIDLKRVRTIPLLDEDVHSLEALAELGSYIFDEPMSERMHGRTA